MPDDAELYWDRHDLAEELFEALLAANVGKAREILAKDSSLAQEHQPYNFDGSAMNLAVMGGSLEAVDLLLQHGATANDGSLWWAGSFSPLITAIRRKDEAMTRHLIAKGATITAYEASAMGDLKALRERLDEDPESVNMRGGDGQTPLHVAANVEAAKLLLERGADLSIKDVDHESTPVQYAIDRPEVAEFLISQGAKGDPFLYACLPDPSRLRAALQADPGIVGLRFGPDTFPTSPGAALMVYAYSIGLGSTLLHTAAFANIPENIALLIGAGADPNVRGGYDDATPLHLAAWNDKPDAIRALAKLGAEVDIPSGQIHRNSPLGWAIVGGSLGAVEALLEVGARVRSYHVEDAEVGAKGAFDQFRRPPEGDRLKIRVRIQLAILES
jgi:ankyrin repeat protein